MRALGILGLVLFLAALGGGLVYGLVVVGRSGEPVGQLAHPGGEAEAATMLALDPAMSPLRATLRVRYAQAALISGGILRGRATLAGPDGVPLWDEPERLSETGDGGTGVSSLTRSLRVFEVAKPGPHRLALSFDAPAGFRVTSAEVVVRRNVRRMSWPVVGAFVLAGLVGLALVGLSGIGSDEDAP